MKCIRIILFSFGVAAATQASTNMLVMPSFYSVVNPPSSNTNDPIIASRQVPWLGNVGIIGGIPSSLSKTVYTNVATGVTPATLGSLLASCPANQVVQLTNGTYNLNDIVQVFRPNDGVVMRGATNSDGTPATKLVFSDGTPESFYLLVGYAGLSTSANLSQDAVKGSTTINVASVPSWVVVGELIGIDQTNDASFASDKGTEGGQSYREIEGQGARGLGQIDRVLAKTSTNITVEIPLYYGFKVAQAAQIFQPGYDTVNATAVRGFGFENIQLSATFSNIDNHAFKIESGDQCYWKNCVITNWAGGAAVWSFMSYRMQAEHCKVADGQYYTSGGQSYGFAWYHLTSGCLVWNCIFDKLHNAMTANYGAAGNVWAYNYEKRGQSSGQNPGMNTHGVHTYMNLWEGNYCEDKLLADWTHGSSSHCTIFRNRVTGENNNPSFLDSRCCVSVEYYNRYWNILGNILGTTGLQNKYIEDSSSQSQGSQGSVMKIGANVNINDDFSTNDVNSYTAGSFILLHGNWESVGASQHWESAVSSHTLKSSYFLTNKPDFFGSVAWPPFDPGTPSATNKTQIPAGSGATYW